jgi:hypothetical protein
MRTLGLSGDAANPLATDASYFALLVLVIIAFVAVLALRRHRPERPGRLASNKRRTAYYAERDWRSLREGGELCSLESLAGERVRYIVSDDRVPLFSSRGFELRELHRVAAVGRGARVYELIPCTQVESPQPRAGIGAGPSSYARH